MTTNSDTRVPVCLASREAAAEVRAEIGRQNKSGSWLAREVSMTDSKMYRRLNSHVDFSIDELQLVAEVLKVPLSQLVPELAS